MPKANNKRKRDNTVGLESNTTSVEEEASKPMAPAQDNSSNDDKQKQGNDLEGRDFYEVLGIKKDATDKEITMAYRKLAMKIHPDKNRDDPFANEKFHTLGKIHMTLSDPEKRKIYDETGQTSDEAANLTEAEWTNYFNLIFKKVTKKGIVDFSKKYRGSEEEKAEVLEAYVTCKGNMTKVLDKVVCSREEDLSRFSTYCKEAIDAGKVEEYKAFKKFEKLVGKDLTIKDDSAGEEEIPKELAQSFAHRKQAFDDLTDKLMAKYGGAKNSAGEGGAKKKKVAAPAASRSRKGLKKKVVSKKKAKEVEEEEEDELSEEGEAMEG